MYAKSRRYKKWLVDVLFLTGFLEEDQAFQELTELLVRSEAVLGKGGEYGCCTPI
jgi:hypothetical protein